MGRADDRARAVSRDRIPTSDGGACRRRQPGRGAPRVRAVPAAARGRARRLPVARDRVDLPRASRSAAARTAAAVLGRPADIAPRPDRDRERADSARRARSSPTRRRRRLVAVVMRGRSSDRGDRYSPPACCSRRMAPTRRDRGVLRRLARDLPPRRRASRSGRSRVGASPGAVAVGERLDLGHERRRGTRVEDRPREADRRPDDPGRQRPERESPLGGGFVWVANSLDGTVSRIDPSANGGAGGVVDTMSATAPSGSPTRRARSGSRTPATTRSRGSTPTAASRRRRCRSPRPSSPSATERCGRARATANRVVRIDPRPEARAVRSRSGTAPPAIAFGERRRLGGEQPRRNGLAHRSGDEFGRRDHSDRQRPHGGRGRRARRLGEQPVRRQRCVRIDPRTNRGPDADQRRQPAPGRRGLGRERARERPPVRRAVIAAAR